MKEFEGGVNAVLIASDFTALALRPWNARYCVNSLDSGRLFQLSMDLLVELIAEQIRVFQDPVDSCIHTQVFTGLFGLYPLVPLYFSTLKLQI
jgi:hypothetical protein